MQGDGFLRVKADKVTHLLDLVGELSLVAAAVIHHPDLEQVEREGFEIAAHRLEVLVRTLQDLAASLRLVPVATVFKRVPRLVRDLSRQTGKPVDLVVEGEEVEIDKVVVDQLHEPLVHLIRNAVDHGLEPPEERIAAGKPEKGRITLRACQQGGEVHITVADDGRGLNRDEILRRARELGLAGADEEPDEATVWSYIFHPGFSTAREVSHLSGRGVGMDVVQATVRSLRGRVRVESARGEGTRITLCIPLTLAFVDSMVVRSQGCLYAIPVDVVSAVFRPEAAQVTRASAASGEWVRVRGTLVPVCRLQRFYGTGGRERPLHEQVVVAVHTTRGALALCADEVVGQFPVTMKPLQGQLKGVRAGAGYALLASGEVAVALDCERLSQEWLGRNGE